MNAYDWLIPALVAGLITYVGCRWAFNLWPFHGGRMFVWPFKRRKWTTGITDAQLAAYQADNEAAYGKPSYHNPWPWYGRDWGKPYISVGTNAHETLVDIVKFQRTDTMTEGIHLSTNGKRHECKPPAFKWERGSNLKNVWMCKCGKRFRLRAYRSKSVTDVRTAYHDGYGTMWPRYRTVADTDKPLTYYDILRIGHEVKALSKLARMDIHMRGGIIKDLTPEETVNRTVVFGWEPITRKPKAGK